MNTMIDLSTIAPGFKDPAIASQASFRKFLLAMSEPGTIVTMDDTGRPDGVSTAMATFALTLVDIDTFVWLDEQLNTPEIQAWLKFHCNSPLTNDADSANFAFIKTPQAAPDLSAFNQGDPKYPDQSTTLVIEVESLDAGETITLEGPGIPGTRQVTVSGLKDSFWTEWAENQALFQLGVDVILVSESKLMGLPRTTRRIEKNGG